MAQANQPEYSEAVCTARDYYDSCDADNFYFTIWGGEDIHVGLYKTPDEDIADASRRTVETMAGRLSRLAPGCKVLDMGAGFGGAARWLAKEHGCEVVALNLSTVQNRRDRELNQEQGLAEVIEVLDGSFEEVPHPDASFDVIWSQDSFLHSGHRELVMDEAARLLKPGGEMVFTDPMAADDCPPGVLQPILDRIHLETLGSPGFYRRALTERGLEDKGFEDHTHQLANHYWRVLKETEAREADLRKVVSQDYIDRMKVGLNHWVEGGKKGHLAWGILHFRKS
jgi:sarcosine/dimethylglycine N-methyltransferase